MEYLPEGGFAPEFELRSFDDEVFSLSNRRQSTSVMLVFYKSACPTCQMTLPFIQQLYDSFASESRPQIWGVSQDDAVETQRFSRELGIRFPVLVDEHPYPVSVAYGLQYVPTVYLIGSDCRIKLADFGFSKPTLRAIAEIFAAEVNEQVPVLFPEGDKLPERRPG